MKDPREVALAIFQWIRPSFLSRDPHFNFITVHYFWIIGWAILGSILIYSTARGELAYIDALFFATGANTQAGLNTVDTNLLNLFAQIIIYIMAMLSSPITIHGISKSRSKAKPTAADVEKGVNGRHITVMYNTAKASRMTNDGTLLDGELMNGTVEPNQTPNETQSTDDADPNGSDHPARHGPPQIKFSDQVKRSNALDDDGDENVPLPQRRSDAEHIAILERQRKGNKSVLRIPGPRDVERGVRPEEFEEDEETQAEDVQAAAHTVSPLKFRKNRVQGEKLQTAETSTSTNTHRANPLQRIKTALTQILVLLNGLDLLLFIILDLNSEVVEQLPLNIRFLDGWFQATSTRTAGFSCVNLANLHPAIQVSYMVMMYISVFPIAISIRSTNVYEEKSLGVYKPVEEVDDENPSGMAYLGSHLRRQLSFDLWYVFIGFFILSISEGSRLASGDISMFAVLFEIVSAYGTVGLSLGYATVNTSLCSQFTVVGKLVIIAMMIRGRHRGLPYGLDRAVLLPSEHLNRKEAEEAELRLQRRDSAVTTGRAASLARGRSHSVDRRHVLTNLLHPGPVFPVSMAKSGAKSEHTLNFGYSETLKKYKTNQEEEEEANQIHLSTPPRPQRRATTQPVYEH
ncbi:putative low-affinity potassium transport protein [Eutypa lata UCREL1]|uniref:Putative low-affinity potassium transport protein n=1 Tax=Eutypa lata (strain UCR-EL1) TaxID=1287681 RepID=M7T3N4_EUTLA|nr:putative low-affinity potassium transport protein [Eutypa lata UCREL1]